MLPPACSRGCAELFLPWFEECSWEEQIGGHPSWVWAGFEWACVLTLDSITTECVVDADTNPSAWSILQQCDGTCDCPDCDDETTCNYPTSICSDDERCSCNSGAMLPFAWVCDGVNDCGMGEDESVSSCGLKGVQAVEVFDATVETTGSNRLCANRWRDEVEASCGATDVASSQNMCSSACAAFYLSWFLDCKETIVGSAGDSHARVAIALNRRFMCCMHGTCTAEQHNNLVACDGSALVESLDDLADGECTASLNCAEFGRDGGDCDRRASARMQYTVAGPVGPDEFIAAVADNVRWLSAENVVVLKFHQTISGSIVLSSPTVAGVYMSRPASRTQLKRAIGRWLNVFADDVSIDDIHDVDAGDHGRRQRRRLQRDSRSVRVAFTVASEKDVTGPFDSTDKASAFRDILNEATPRVIDQLVALAPEDNVRFETDRLTVETEIVCFITVGYIEYELALGVQLPDFADLSTEIQLGLSDYVRIEQSLLERCGGSLCATSVLARPISLTIADLGRGNTIPAAKSPPEEEASLLGAAVAVVGGAICVYSLIICVQYGFRLKQSRALVVYSDGVQVGDFGTLADELQRQVLERLIDRWVMQEELKIEADCDASKKALTNEITGTMLKNPLLVPECHGTDANVGGPAKISERLLVQAMDADRAVPIANRSTRHQQAQARLTSARTNAAANLRATLQKAGIETDVIEELEEEVSAMDEYADAQIASLNSSLDQAEVQMLRGHGNDFATQIARAETEVSRRAIQDQYSALVAEELHKLATTRAQERLVLCDTLMARRAALAKTHEDALIDAVLDTRAQEQQDEQGRAKLQDLLTEMKQMHDSVADGAVATPDEHQDALGVVVLRAIVLQQEARSAGEIDYWAHYATRVQDEQQSVAEARRARRSEARERLVLARKLLVETRKTALAAQGAPNALMEDQFAETAAMQNEQDSQREEFEAEIEQKKKQQVLTKTAQFEAAMEACGSSAGREKLAATYATGLEVAYAQLESACAEQRAKLHARLGKRNEMLTEQHAKAMALMMTGNASGVHTATAQVEAREIALANASPQQYEYMKLLMEMEKPSATADDNSLAARRRLAQERLTGRRQAMNDRHRKELLNAGVPADMIDRHITDIELHDVFADREAEQVEEQAESEQRNVVANGGNPAVAEAQVANKRMKTRAKLRANLRARRSALGRKHRTELVRTVPTGARTALLGLWVHFAKRCTGVLPLSQLWRCSSTR